MPSRARKLGSSRDAVEATRRLEAIVASALDGIITFDDNQLIILFNPAAERMFGLGAAEAIGQPISRFMPDRILATHADQIGHFADTGAIQRPLGALVAISGLRVDGSAFPIEASISQVEVAGERLATVILRDITQRMAAQDALLESRRRMEGIVESAMDALISVDEDQRITLFNPAAERMFGVESADAVGTAIEQFLPHRFRAGHAEHIRRFKETGVTNRAMGALGSISGLRANGEEFPLEASISQIEIGGVKLATVILRDIAERKSNDDARHLLAREVDHRAKNALAVVQALVSLSQAGTKEEFIAAVRGRVSALGRAHSLLAQNRWEGGDLAQIVTDETAAYQGPGQIQIHGRQVVLSPNAVQPISLLVHELATNAIKYGSLSVDRGLVEFSWRLLPAPQPGLELRWTESGGPPVLEPQSKGFGSTLVREVVTRQLQGSLDLRWPPEGLQLVATLPPSAYRIESSESSAGPLKAKPNRTAPAGRLLIVEDESLIAMELCKELRSLGWTIIGPAATIDEAMSLVADADMPDAAVLDVNLGGTLVYPLAEMLKARGVPFVLCTGYQQLDDHEHFRDWPLIRKPVSIPMLDLELRRCRATA